MAAPPIIGQGLNTDYPPVVLVLASAAQSSKPYTINLVTISYSLGCIYLETAKTINILDMSVIPIAYKSLRTLQQPIRPYI